MSVAGFRPGLGRGGITQFFVGPIRETGMLVSKDVVAILSIFDVLTDRTGAGAIFAGEAADDGVEVIGQASLRLKIVEETDFDLM